MTIYTYGVCIKNKSGGSDFFAINATSASKAESLAREHVADNDNYPPQEELVAWVQHISEMLHEQFRDIVQLGGF